ncbi:putative transcriptional regulator [Litoreibacter ponti]|uniref:Putative transcriptional regulator n=1 Tax=Litoreibacter ponti TaxID=1510457 RepID=A0A2T6BJD4_9RHOB|nr:BlaI/MecI/CopY family transcriptional regulator [Litoreibacter ponti]PTX56152.1 putative transcriptional regulator [Litoreibacter ponti]
MKQKKKNDLLTEVELEFMTQLWALEEGTVRDVLDQLPEGRNLAYTSAATILRILEQKGFVTSRKDGKRHIFTPALAKDAYQTRSLKHLSVKLFDDAPAALVARLVDDAELTDEALGQIRALVDRRLKNDTG